MSKIADLFTKAERAEAEAAQAREEARRASAEAESARMARLREFDQRVGAERPERIAQLQRQRQEAMARFAQGVIESEWGQAYIEARRIDALLLEDGMRPPSLGADLLEPMVAVLEDQARSQARGEIEERASAREAFADGEEER